MGQLKEFTFHAYWYPDSDSFELRQIGNLRPPNEVIQRANDVVVDNSEGTEYQDLSDSDPVYLGVASVEFVYFPDSPEQNRLNKKGDSFESRIRVENGTLVGDSVMGKYQKAGVIADNPHLNYEPYQDKGWLRLNGKYYTPSDTKPSGWSK